MIRRTLAAFALAALAFAPSAHAGVGSEILSFTYNDTTHAVTNLAVAVGGAGVAPFVDTVGTLGTVPTTYNPSNAPTLSVTTPTVAFTSSTNLGGGLYEGTGTINGTSYKMEVEIGVITLLGSGTIDMTTLPTVPEPASLGLMGLGIVGFGAYRLRRKRSV